MLIFFDPAILLLKEVIFNSKVEKHTPIINVSFSFWTSQNYLFISLNEIFFTLTFTPSSNYLFFSHFISYFFSRAYISLNSHTQTQMKQF